MGTDHSAHAVRHCGRLILDGSALGGIGMVFIDFVLSGGGG